MPQAQIERHIGRITQQLHNNGGTLLHTPLLCRNPQLGAKALRAVIDAMKARGIVTETWTHDEHSYSVVQGEENAQD